MFNACSKSCRYGLLAVTFTFSLSLFTFLSQSAFAADCRVIDPELQDLYEGGCRNGLANGTGYARGTAQYQGEFRKGLKHGKGVKTSAWADRYAGGFVYAPTTAKSIYV